MISLEIKCRVIEPILTFGDGLNLDGLLAYAMFKTCGEELEDPNTSPFPKDFDLPIKKWTIVPHESIPEDSKLRDDRGMVWGWHTSDAIYEVAGRQIYAYRGKADGMRIKRYSDASSINISNGEFKGINLSHEGMWPTGGELTWFAVGDKKKVGELLKLIPNIGKKHNLGQGLIERDLYGTPIWNITEIENDRSLDNRRMPIGFREGVPRIASIRAPNWHRSRHVFTV